MSLDLNDVCTRYYDDKFRGATRRGEINYNRLKLEIDSTEWIDVDSSSEPPETRTVETWQNEVSSRANLKVQSTYCLNEAYIKGLNTSLRVPMDAKLDVFGKSLEVQLGQRERTDTSTIPIQVTATRPFSRGEASQIAWVNTTTSSGSGTFCLDVKLRGDVVFPLNNGCDTATIAEIVKHSGCPRGFSVSGKNVKFTVEGRCGFRLENHTDIVY